MPNLIHIDHTGQVVWHLVGGGMAGEANMSCGIQTDNTDVQEVCDKLSEAFKTSVLAFTYNGMVLWKTTTRLRLAGNIEIAESYPSTQNTGASGNGSLPMNTAVLIQKRTNFAGRKNRGRFYLPGISENHVTGTIDPNTLTASALLSGQELADLLYTKMTSTDGGDAVQPVILHPEPSTTVTVVTSFSMQARLATQRGRMRD